MTYEQEFEALGTSNQIVYVRPIQSDELPSEMQEQARDMTDLYSVHAPNGDRLAVVKDRKLAFALARQNNFAPVDVH